MELTRNLKRGMKGDDVRWVKDNLFALGYYAKKITKITNSTFGGDTVKAVKAFQNKHDLVIDGIYGKKSHAKLTNILNGKNKDVEYVTEKEFPRISATVAKKINVALNDVSKERREIVLEALKYATDASTAAKYKHPLSLYIRGGNLYNTNDKLNVISYEYLTETYAKKYADYCTSGRLDMMKNAVKANPSITGADCSGGIIGILRHFGHISMKTDATANGLCGSGYSVAIKKDELTAGDFIGKDGHICLYVGGGYMAEWAGGEYGCQISNLNDRRCYSYTKKKMVKLSACKKYRRPKIYA